jgi:hypothetical protein
MPQAQITNQQKARGQGKAKVKMDWRDGSINSMNSLLPGRRKNIERGSGVCSSTHLSKSEIEHIT